MNDQIRAQLQQGHTIDITTIGRKSGKPSRIELVFQNIDGTVFLSGTPGRRDWYANLVANPEFTFHLKKDVQADLPACARPVTNTAERRKILTPYTASWDRAHEVEDWIERSPLVEVTFTEG